MDTHLIKQISPIQAIYISKSFCDVMNSQSCDCDRLIIQSGDKFVLFNYLTHGEEGYVEWEAVTSFNPDDYPYEVILFDSAFKFDKISYSENGFVEGVRFAADGVFLFVFGSEYNLILTASKYDLFGDDKMDFPETEAVLQIALRK